MGVKIVVAVLIPDVEATSKQSSALENSRRLQVDMAATPNSLASINYLSGDASSFLSNIECSLLPSLDLDIQPWLVSPFRISYRA